MNGHEAPALVGAAVVVLSGYGTKAWVAYVVFLTVLLLVVLYFDKNRKDEE